MVGHSLHLWRCDLDGLEVPPETLAILDAEERRRGAAFAFPKHRERFKVGHCLLRVLLGRELGLHPRDVPLRLSEIGKPYLQAAGAPSFNVSHSGGVWYAAVWEKGGDVGVDVELARPVEDALSLAKRVFSTEECAALQQSSAAERSADFLRGWTRKEAFVKALGVGLGVDLRAITVGIRNEKVTVAPVTGISNAPVLIQTLAHVVDEHVAIACASPLDQVIFHSLSAVEVQGFWKSL